MVLTNLTAIDLTEEPSPGWCEERKRLFIQAVATIKSLVSIQQAQAEIELGQSSSSRLEDQAKAALIAWKNARQAYVQHVRAHGC